MTTKTKTLPIRERIRQANTGLQEAVALRERLQNFAATREFGNADVDAKRRLYAGDDPADVFNDYAVAIAQQGASDLFGKLTANILQTLAVAQTFEERFTDEALTICRDELDSIMARVAKHRHLIENHPTTAEEALRVGNLSDWETVEQILTDYQALRAEHARQVRLQDKALLTRVVDSFQCREFLDVDRHWAYRRRTTPIADNYPAPEVLRFFRADVPTITNQGPAQWILTVADHQPWLPDATQIATLNNRLEQLCSRPWHTDRSRADRTWFAESLAEIRIISSQQ